MSETKRAAAADEVQRWRLFAQALAEVRDHFPEHIREIDRCIYEVGQKLAACDDPNCTCRMRAENFQAISRQMARRSYEFD